ncbi:phage tail protein [Gibbsiella quercinecans]|uniref:phage tail protein n=1 Tax=Gibbsiella quercinecans TaxID=929813 RepID=UPI00242BDF6B|nr:phage tail protein [Gibbsiella quercinecans]
MHLPNGTKVFVESGRDAAVPFTKITNAAENPQLTVDDVTKFSVKDVLIITESTWTSIVNKIVRVKEINDTNKTVTVEELDTSDVNVFPAGGSGSVVKVTSWIEIPCVQETGKDGNEQQYYNYQCLSDEEEQSEPTYKSATTLTFTFAHDYTNPIYDVLRAADKAKLPIGYYMYVPRAAENRYWTGTPSFDDIPTTAVNEMETVGLSIAVKGKHIFLPA